MSYTDYPQIDVDTHRKLASINDKLSFGVLLIGLYYATQLAADQSLGIVASIAAFAAVQVTSIGLKLQALRWEIEDADQ